MGGGRGVAIGHDLPTEEWEAVIENSLENFENNPHVLQKFHTAERVRMQYYDFDVGDVQEMTCRPLLRPYYFVVGNTVKLGGMQAAVCPADKKILHGIGGFYYCAVRKKTIREICYTSCHYIP